MQDLLLRVWLTQLSCPTCQHPSSHLNIDFAFSLCWVWCPCCAEIIEISLVDLKLTTAPSPWPRNTNVLDYKSFIQIVHSSCTYWERFMTTLHMYEPRDMYVSHHLLPVLPSTHPHSLCCSELPLKIFLNDFFWTPFLQQLLSTTYLTAWGERTWNSWRPKYSGLEHLCLCSFLHTLCGLISKQFHYTPLMRS